MKKPKIGKPRDWWNGYLAGIINGISMRPDVPVEVRDKCKEVVEKYNEWQDERLK